MAQGAGAVCGAERRLAVLVQIALLRAAFLAGQLQAPQSSGAVGNGAAQPG
ncbi:MAG: hypothetical protein NT169_21310 [Chloroflexi bacterium]|nr:hypothetical protein [Chloroflexota bacterium]